MQAGFNRTGAPEMLSNGETNYYAYASEDKESVLQQAFLDVAFKAFGPRAVTSMQYKGVDNDRLVIVCSHPLRLNDLFGLQVWVSTITPKAEDCWMNYATKQEPETLWRSRRKIEDVTVDLLNVEEWLQDKVVRFSEEEATAT